MIISLAWKNIWRNKVRSSVILGAIALGLCAGTYLTAFTKGWMLSTVNDDIRLELSHIQLHDSAFIANNDIGDTFNEADVAAKLATLPVHKVVSYRLKLNGMLASAHNAVGVAAKAVDPTAERAISTVDSLIADSLGVFLTDEGRLPIVISSRTADKLKVRLHSKIVFTFQDTSGEMQSMAFRICGIFRSSDTAFDEGTVFVRYTDVQPLTGLPVGAMHEAGILLADLPTCAAVAPQLRTMFPALKVQSWDELNPTIAMSLSMMDLSTVIILSIFLFALSFGIINTMLMAILERTRELGMLGAIGMSKGRMFGMIMLETVFLTLLGSVIGVVLAVALLIPSLHSGVDLTPLMGDVFEDYGFSSIVYPILQMRMFVYITILVIIAGVLSAIYPARKALQLKILDAMRA